MKFLSLLFLVACTVEPGVSVDESYLLTTGYVHCGDIRNCSLDNTGDANNKICAGICNVTVPGSQYNSAGCSVEPDPNSHNNGVVGWCSYKP